MSADNLRSAALQYAVAAMSVTGFIGGIIVIALTLTFAVASAEDLLDDDPVVASFERELNHESPPAPMVTRSAIQDDVLYETLNTIHWSAAEAPVEVVASDDTAEMDDPALDSGLELVAADSESSGKSAL
jgi:hypothetical protein